MPSSINGSKSRQAVDSFWEEYQGAIGRILKNPWMYLKADGRQAGREIRLLSIQNFPLWIIYELMGEEIVVLALWHQKSRGEDWSQRAT